MKGNYMDINNNFSQELYDKGTLEDKLTVINRVIFGDNRDNWLNYKEMVKFLSDKFPPKPEYVTQRMIEVLKYLAGDSSTRPYSLAVYDDADYIRSCTGAYGKSIKDWEKTKSNSLLHAASIGDLKNTKQWIEYGADLDRTSDDDYGYTPLIWAIHYSPNSKIVRTIYGTTHQVPAAKKQNASMNVVKALVEAGAKVDVPDKNGNLPIIHAILYNNPDVVCYLIDNGASLDTKDKSGKTVRDWAKKSSTEIAKVIRERYL